ncbi:hypothetical protein [Clostridium sp.]|uniref:hypothetical protein n=1 Tax=Clostridium sp. TaxID=1506 RepID=UPI0034642CC7
MARNKVFRQVFTSFWEDDMIMDTFTPEDKLFFLYLLTNPRTTQIGIYKVIEKEMAFQLGYSREAISSLLDRFENHHELIIYNKETKEIAIKNWGKYNLRRGGTPFINLLKNELKEVKDLKLILCVYNSITGRHAKKIFNEFMVEKGLINEEIFEEGSEYCEDSSLKDINEDIEEDEYEENDSLHDTDYDSCHDSGGRIKNKELRIKEKYKKEKKGDSAEAEENDSFSQRVPYDEIIALYNSVCKSLPKAKARNDKRDRAMKRLWKNKMFNSLEKLQELFSKANKSDFLAGIVNNFKADFDFVIRLDKSIKIMEGSYDNRKVIKQEMFKPLGNMPNAGAYNKVEY